MAFVCRRNCWLLESLRRVECSLELYSALWALLPVLEKQLVLTQLCVSDDAIGESDAVARIPYQIRHLY